MGDYYFTTKGLTVGYDGKAVVEDIELQINRGQILTLVGPNGAGKTTILKSIIGQLSPIAGVVMLDGRKLPDIDPKTLSKEMAVVLTSPFRTEMMTVEEVVETGRYPYTGRFGMLSEKDHQIVHKVMEDIYIKEWKDRDFTKLSDGQRQKVMLARAIAQQPDILVLDEPTSYLDIKHKVEFLSILKKLTGEENLTVIMSLHEVELACRISDKVGCFKEGLLDRFGTPDEVFQGDYLLTLYDIDLGEVAPEFQDLISRYGKRE